MLQGCLTQVQLTDASQGMRKSEWVTEQLVPAALHYVFNIAFISTQVDKFCYGIAKLEVLSRHRGKQEITNKSLQENILQLITLRYPDLAPCAIQH